MNAFWTNWCCAVLILAVILLGLASALLVFRSGGATGDVIATYGFGTEGLDLYIPGSGILFEEGVHVKVTNCPNVSITFT